VITLVERLNTIFEPDEDAWSVLQPIDDPGPQRHRRAIMHALAHLDGTIATRHRHAETFRLPRHRPGRLADALTTDDVAHAKELTPSLGASLLVGACNHRIRDALPDLISGLVDPRTLCPSYFELIADPAVPTDAMLGAADALITAAWTVEQPTSRLHHTGNAARQAVSTLVTNRRLTTNQQHRLLDLVPKGPVEPTYWQAALWCVDDDVYLDCLLAGLRNRSWSQDWPARTLPTWAIDRVIDDLVRPTLNGDRSDWDQVTAALEWLVDQPETPPALFSALHHVHRTATEAVSRIPDAGFDECGFTVGQLPDPVPEDALTTILQVLWRRHRWDILSDWAWDRRITYVRQAVPALRNELPRPWRAPIADIVMENPAADDRCRRLAAKRRPYILARRWNDDEIPDDVVARLVAGGVTAQRAGRRDRRAPAHLRFRLIAAGADPLDAYGDAPLSVLGGLAACTSRKVDGHDEVAGWTALMVTEAINDHFQADHVSGPCC
jgi:hypothetical protein